MGAMDVTLIGALTAGLLSFLSPCILPIVPPYLCFLGGVSLDQLQDPAGSGDPAAEGALRAVRRRVVLASIAFVLGFATIFVALGLGAALAGNVVSRHVDILAPIAGALIVVLGLHFLGVFRLAGLYRTLRFEVRDKPVGLLGAYVVGLAFAFGWTPCVGPVLATILFVAGADPSPLKGASLLGAYALGIGLPFVLAALAIGPFLGFVRRFRHHMPVIEKAMGALLVATGVLFMTGSVSLLAQWLIETIPAFRQVG